MAVTTCPFCGGEIEDATTTCAHCSSDLRAAPPALRIEKMRLNFSSLARSASSKRLLNR